MLKQPGASSLEEVQQAIQALRSQTTPPAVVVFTNGVFDLPHPGHLCSLRAARGLGDILVVGINSDESVARLKGPGRPIIPANERAKILSSFEIVDFEVIFPEDTPLNIVRALQPDVIAKGEEYRNREVVGADIVCAAGGRVEFLPMEAGVSSTDIISRIVQAHQD
jgi:D-beta-D-heptose 7-phosphate kinase/D-beta-D-heptose 1-phosphate adenosyltransferase